MKNLLLSLVIVLAASAHAADKPALNEQDAIQSITAGQCGAMKLGKGWSGAEGWAHQPIPGDVKVRVVGEGTVSRCRLCPPGKSITLDMAPGRPEYIVKSAKAVDLEWKVPGHEWGPIPKGFLLEPTFAK